MRQKRRAGKRLRFQDITAAQGGARQGEAAMGEMKGNSVLKEAKRGERILSQKKWGAFHFFAHRREVVK
jgi:hypothetical protein